MTKTEAELSGLTFGCELEYEGIGQTHAARLIAEVTGGRCGGYASTDATMPDGLGTWSTTAAFAEPAASRFRRF